MRWYLVPVTLSEFFSSIDLSKRILLILRPYMDKLYRETQCKADKELVKM